MHSPITDKSCKVAAKVTVSPVITTKFILHSDAKVKLIVFEMLSFFKKKSFSDFETFSSGFLHCS